MPDTSFGGPQMPFSTLTCATINTARGQARLLLKYDRAVDDRGHRGCPHAVRVLRRARPCPAQRTSRSERQPRTPTGEDAELGGDGFPFTRRAGGPAPSGSITRPPAAVRKANEPQGARQNEPRPRDSIRCISFSFAPANAPFKTSPRVSAASITARKSSLPRRLIAQSFSVQIFLNVITVMYDGPGG